MKSRLLPSLLALSWTLYLALGLSTSCVLVRADGFAAAQDSFASSPTLANQHLTQANAALQSGRYQEALSSFDLALQADPTSWLTYYRRATAQLSLGRTSAALQDFQSLLDLNPKFEKAYLQQAKVYLKEGDYDKAKAALKTYDLIRAEKNASQSGSSEANSVRTKLVSVETSLKSLTVLVKELDKAKASNKGKGKGKEVDVSKMDHCIHMAGEILKISPSHLETRLVRARCQTIKGNVEDAMADWTRVVHLSPSPFLLRRLAVLSYFLVSEPGSQSRDAGLQHLKACLHSDPDNKSCAKMHRKVKSLEKSLKKARNFYNSQSYRAVLSALKGGKVGGPTVVDEIKEVIKAAADLQPGDEEPLIPSTYKGDPVQDSNLLHELYTMYCKSYTELNDMEKAMPYCELVLAKEPDNVEAVLARAELALQQEKYEEAVRDLNKAFDASGRTDRNIHQKLQTAEKRLKLSKSKDYYKVLGVKRSDSLATIKKAYRKMARENHPDKGGSQEKMAQINEAWGVLGDEELRKRYDAGDDPNDPMGSQQGGYGNPFAQGGHPFEMFFQQGAGGFPGGGSFGGFPGGQQFHFKMG